MTQIVLKLSFFGIDQVKFLFLTTGLITHTTGRQTVMINFIIGILITTLLEESYSITGILRSLRNEN